VLVFVLSLATTPGWRHETLTGLPSVLLYGGNWARAFGPFNSLGLLGHTWSLAVEEQFYLVWPFVCLLLICRSTRRLRAAAVVATLAVLDCAYLLFAMAHWGEQQGFFRTDTHSMGLLAGAALALVIGGPSPTLRLSERGAWMLRRLAVMATAIIAFLALLQPKTPPQQGIMIITATGATVALVARLVLDGAGRLARLFGSRPARWVGRRSYGIYLYHFPIAVVFVQQRGLHGLAYAAAVVGCLTASIGLAALSYRFVEAPFLRLKARFTTKTPVPSLQRV
jgi:peptidoglycan/LPS O-acetylase OafA/YrhL